MLLTDINIHECGVFNNDLSKHANLYRATSISAYMKCVNTFINHFSEVLCVKIKIMDWSFIWRLAMQCILKDARASRRKPTSGSLRLWLHSPHASHRTALTLNSLASTYSWLSTVLNSFQFWLYFMLYVDCRVYAACKVATLILKTSGKRRISGLEAFERIMVVVPVSLLA